jgi:signal transduction histidine kinase
MLSATEAEVLSAVAHDLRNSITTIGVFAEIAAAILPGLRGRRREELNYALGRILVNISTLNDLVGQLTTSGESLPMQGPASDLVELAPLVTDIVADLQVTSGRVIELTVFQNDLRGLWSPVSLKRVLANLLENAIKYSPPDSPITVSVYEEPAPERGWGVIEVQDQGIGVPAEELALIFGDQYRATNALGHAPGRGLGLVSVKRLVELHAGTVTVESVEGQGSTFRVRLPLRHAGPIG